MKALVLQMKRIGDLVLTAPALVALRESGAEITLVVDGPCASLLPTLPIAEGLSHSRKGGNKALWKRIRSGKWDVCLDFTGTDRSALMAWLSGAQRRITFEYVRKRFLRRLAYHEFVDSPVRLSHTVEHCLDLLKPLKLPSSESVISMNLPLAARQQAAALLAERGITGSYVLVHPGTARAEKYWLPERWAAVIAHLGGMGLSVVVTCGPDKFEREHVEKIMAAVTASQPQHPVITVFPPDLLILAALVEKARLTLSCDTAVVHMASALRQPQVALFGPTNPFHWRPRHERAVVISAPKPEAPMTGFQPKMKGAPTENIPVETVIRAAESLLTQR